MLTLPENYARIQRCGRLWPHSEQCACYQIWRVYVGLPYDALREWRFVAGNVWIDDSGKHGPPVYVLGGYAANVITWFGFAEAWEKILHRPHPSSLLYLKAEEAAHLSGQFEGWSAKDRDERLLAFAKLIERFQLIRVEVVIRYDDFDELIKQNRGPFKEPPVFGVTCLLTAMLDGMTRENNKQELDFFFDKGSVREGDLTRAYDLIHKDDHKEIATLLPNRPILRDDKSWMPLQAADLYAWHVRRDHFEDGKLDSEIWRMLQSRPVLDCGVTYQEMLDMIAGMPGKWPKWLMKPQPKQKKRR